MYDYDAVWRAIETTQDGGAYPRRGQPAAQPVIDVARQLAYPWWALPDGKAVHLVHPRVMHNWRMRWARFASRYGTNWPGMAPTRFACELPASHHSAFVPVRPSRDSRPMCERCSRINFDPDDPEWDLPAGAIEWALDWIATRRHPRQYGNTPRRSRAQGTRSMSLDRRIQYGLQHDPSAWTDLGDGRWRAPKGAIYGERTAVVQAVIRRLQGIGAEPTSN